MAVADVGARQGASIREFLRYYVLVLLRGDPTSDAEMRAAIESESEENRKYRPSGQLVVSRHDLRLVLGQLHRRGLISRASNGWSLTASGKARLARYAEQKEAHTNAKEGAARRLLQLIGPPGPGETALDVGTGEGFLAFKLAERGYRVVGIDSGRFDYSRDSIQAAAREGESRDVEVQFREVPVGDLARSGERFDNVVTSQAMHCMRDQMQCLEAVYGLLKPGGAFVCMDFLVGLEGFMQHGWHSFLALSREEWKHLLPQCGFDEVSDHKVGDYLVVRAVKPAPAAGWSAGTASTKGNLRYALGK